MLYNIYFTTTTEERNGNENIVFNHTTINERASISSGIHAKKVQLGDFNAQLPLDFNTNRPSMLTGVGINDIDNRLLRIEELFMQEQEFITALRTMRQLLQKPKDRYA